MHMKAIFGSSMYNKTGKGYPKQNVHMEEKMSIFTILSFEFYDLIIGVHFGEM